MADLDVKRAEISYWAALKARNPDDPASYAEAETAMWELQEEEDRAAVNAYMERREASEAGSSGDA